MTLTTKQMAEVMLAAEYDDRDFCINIQFRHRQSNGKWCKATSPTWDWQNTNFRVINPIRDLTDEFLHQIENFDDYEAYCEEMICEGMEDRANRRLLDTDH